LPDTVSCKKNAEPSKEYSSLYPVIGDPLFAGTVQFNKNTDAPSSS
jgi:hypothetical protein